MRLSPFVLISLCATIVGIVNASTPTPTASPTEFSPTQLINVDILTCSTSGDDSSNVNNRISFPTHPELGPLSYLLEQTPSAEGTLYRVLTNVLAPNPIDIIQFDSETTDALCITQVYVNDVPALAPISGTNSGGPYWIDQPCDGSYPSYGCATSWWFFWIAPSFGPATDVALSTCSVTDSGTVSSNYHVRFPTYPWIDEIRFEDNPGLKDTEYTLITGATTFPADLDAIAIVASSSDVLCLDELTVNGVSVASGLPINLEDPCGAVDRLSNDVKCQTVQLFAMPATTPATSVTADVSIKVCDSSVGVSSPETLESGYRVSFPSNTGFSSFLFETAPNTVGGTFMIGTGVQVPNPLTVMEITAEVADRLCIEDIYINGESAMLSGQSRNYKQTSVPTVIREPCDAVSNGGVECRTSQIFTFDTLLLEPSAAPTAAPTAALITSIENTVHPYLPWTREKWTVDVPGVSCYKLNMDERSWTPDRDDFVKIWGVTGGVRRQYGAHEENSGLITKLEKRLYKARLSQYPETIINEDSLQIEFKSNGYRQAWGFKLYVWECD